jgi:hypothetical protein
MSALSSTHLARYFAETYPHDCPMVAVPGADRFSSTIAMVAAAALVGPGRVSGASCRCATWTTRAASSSGLMGVST